MDGVGGSSGSYGCPFHRHHASTKRSMSTMADNYRSASPDTLFVQQDDHYANEHTSQRRRPNGLALPSRAPLHFAGDGLDFRRPIMTSGGAAVGTGNRNAANVIDLTEEDVPQHSGHAGAEARREHASLITAGSSRAQRGPRFGRNIIDVESEAEEEETHARPAEDTNFARHFPPRDLHNPTLHPRYSLLRRPNRPSAEPRTMDDIEFLEERPLPQRLPNRSHTPAQRSITPFPGGAQDTIDLTGEDDDDEVLHMDTRPRPGINNDRPVFPGGAGARGVAAIADLFGGADRLRNRFGDFFRHAALVDGEVEAQRRAHEDITHAHHRNTGTNNNRQRDDGMPRAVLLGGRPGPGMMIAMDYATPAFGMGYAGANEPTAPIYEPPPAAATGFTRSPEEDEVVVCPNCGDELAVGETDEQQEVWVIKKCGHAYCGNCAKNHTKATKAPRKGKGKAPAVTSTDGVPNFKQCVVDGCKESATAKSFVHVFVGG